MNSNSFTETVVEDAALAWMESLGYSILHGTEIAPDELREKNTHRQTSNSGAKT